MRRYYDNHDNDDDDNDDDDYDDDEDDDRTDRINRTPCVAVCGERSRMDEWAGRLLSSDLAWPTRESSAK